MCCHCQADRCDLNPFLVLAFRIHLTNVSQVLKYLNPCILPLQWPYAPHLSSGLLQLIPLEPSGIHSSERESLEDPNKQHPITNAPHLNPPPPRLIVLPRNLQPVEPQISIPPR